MERNEPFSPPHPIMWKQSDSHKRWGAQSEARGGNILSLRRFIMNGIPSGVKENIALPVKSGMGHAVLWSKAPHPYPILAI